MPDPEVQSFQKIADRKESALGISIENKVAQQSRLSSERIGAIAEKLVESGHMSRERYDELSKVLKKENWDTLDAGERLQEYNKLVKTSLRAWQTKNGLEPDGLFGRYSAAVMFPTEYADEAIAHIRGKDGKGEPRNQDQRAVYSRVVEASLEAYRKAKLGDAFPSLNPDDKTIDKANIEKIVRALQKNAGVTENGELNPRTVDALQKWLKEQAKTPATVTQPGQTTAALSMSPGERMRATVTAYNSKFTTQELVEIGNAAITPAVRAAFALDKNPLQELNQLHAGIAELGKGQRADKEKVDQLRAQVGPDAVGILAKMSAERRTAVLAAVDAFRQPLSGSKPAEANELIGAFRTALGIKPVQEPAPAQSRTPAQVVEATFNAYFAKVTTPELLKGGAGTVADTAIQKAFSGKDPLQELNRLHSGISELGKGQQADSKKVEELRAQVGSYTHDILTKLTAEQRTGILGAIDVFRQAISNPNAAENQKIVTAFRNMFTVEPEKTSASEPVSQPVRKAPVQSASSVVHAESAALGAVEQITGAKPASWSYPNASPGYAAAQNKAANELSTISSFLTTDAGIGDAGAAKVNNTLKQKGYSIALRPNGQADAVYAVGIFDFKGEWEGQGSKDKVVLETSGKNVDAAKVKGGVQFFSARGHEHAIVSVETKNGERVFMTRYDSTVEGKDPAALRRVIEGLDSGSLSSPKMNSEYGSVRFPMVDYDRSGKMEYLEGARTTGADGRPVVLTQALYQHRLRLNDEGVRAEAAAAVSASRGGVLPERPSYDINGAFLVWVKDNTGKVTMFAAQVGEADMKNPGGLGGQTASK